MQTATLKPRLVMPIYTKPGNYLDDQAHVQADIDLLQAEAVGTVADHFARMTKRCGGKRHPLVTYWERYQTEMDLLVSKKFVGYFLMVWRIVKFAKDRGILVGPGRGSGSGCLVALLLGITEIDPVEPELLFARFLTGRTSARRGHGLPHHKLTIDPRLPRTLGRRPRHAGRDQPAAEVQGRDQEPGSDLQRGGRLPGVPGGLRLIDRAEAGEAGLGISWEDL